MFLDASDPRLRAHLVAALGDHMKRCQRDGVEVPWALVALREAARTGQALALLDGFGQDSVVSATVAADLLGISPRSLRRAVAEGRISPAPGPPRARYRLRELERFYAEGRTDERAS
jgi:hypothetical protein